MTREQERLLEPYANLFARAADRIEDLPDPELRALLEAAKAATNVNCWWATYKIAQVIVPIVESELHQRVARGPRHAPKGEGSDV